MRLLARLEDERKSRAIWYINIRQSASNHPLYDSRHPQQVPFSPTFRSLEWNWDTRARTDPRRPHQPP
jgi:hypothetical protein